MADDQQATFPQTEGWDPCRNLVTFPADAGGKPILCMISHDALNRRFGAGGAGADSDDILRAFRANRAASEALAAARIRAGRGPGSAS